MISLTESPRRISATSWMTRPVNASGAGMSNYVDRQDMVAFWLAYSFAFDDTEPLPSMFRRKAQADKADAPSVSADFEGKLSAAARLFQMSQMTGIYILACVLFLFAAVDTALLTIASFSPERAAVTWPAPVDGSTQEPAIRQAEHDLLPGQLEAWVNFGVEESSGVAGNCAVRGCWTTTTIIR
jgi:hypothetical protein